MMKLIILVVVVGVILWMVSLKRREPGRRSGTPPKPQAMVACAHCGVHLPRSEAVLGGDDQPYCGTEHQLAHERGERQP